MLVCRDSKMIWFTSDQHFGHSNIIRYCNRPFDNVEEMNLAIINNHNSLVKTGDIVFHLGDFTFGTHLQYLKRLNGSAHYLILGNHDRKTPEGFGWVKDTYFLKYEKKIQIFLSHYAHRTWPSRHYGSIHLFGHSHGTLENEGNSMDVGVDANDYFPISIEEVLERFNVKI